MKVQYMVFFILQIHFYYAICDVSYRKEGRSFQTDVGFKQPRTRSVTTSVYYLQPFYWLRLLYWYQSQYCLKSRHTQCCIFPAKFIAHLHKHLSSSVYLMLSLVLVTEVPYHPYGGTRQQICRTKPISTSDKIEIVWEIFHF